MLRKLKRFSAQNQLAESLEQHRPQAGKIEKIGLLIDVKCIDADFDPAIFQKAFEVPKENFHSLIFSSEKPTFEKNVEWFNGKDLTWKAKFKKESRAAVFQREEYDLLINYFSKPAPELYILAASVKANLKVGFPMAEKRLNDLEINMDMKDYRLFARELKKYVAVVE